jgi:hypothetical protein
MSFIHSFLIKTGHSTLPPGSILGGQFIPTSRSPRLLSCIVSPNEHHVYDILYHIKGSFKKHTLDQIKESDCLNKEAFRRAIPIPRCNGSADCSVQIVGDHYISLQAVTVTQDSVMQVPRYNVFVRSAGGPIVDALPDGICALRPGLSFDGKHERSTAQPNLP